MRTNHECKSKPAVTRSLSPAPYPKHNMFSSWIAFRSAEVAVDGVIGSAASCATDVMLHTRSFVVLFDSQRLTLQHLWLTVPNNAQKLAFGSSTPVVTHTGALQVAVPFMCRHSGWHSKQVWFTTASRGSLRKQRESWRTLITDAQRGWREATALILVSRTEVKL